MLPYVIGYIFSVVIGHFMIRYSSDIMWKSVGWQGLSDKEFRPDVWQPRLIGIIERVLYLTALILDQGIFIGFWLAIRVATQWKRWEDHRTPDNRLVHGRSIFHNFILGSGLSILYAAVGYGIILWSIGKNHFLVVIVAALLIILNFIAVFYTKHMAAIYQEKAK